MNIRKLTILRGSVRADVQVGTNPWGGAVTVQVELPRKAEEVQTAMATLENLLLRTAQEHIKVSGDREELTKQVNDRVDKVLASERQRIANDATAHAVQTIRRLEDEAVRQVDANRRSQDRLLRDVEAAFHGAEFPDVDRTKVMPVITEVLRNKRNGAS